MKINHLFITVLYLLAMFTVPVPMANAVEIVRLTMEYGGDGSAAGGFSFPKVTRTLDLELYDVDQDGVDIAPLTVGNFLNYVNDGRYDGVVVNRKVPGFIVQMGGFTFRPNDPVNDPVGPITADSYLQTVPADAPVVNEFNLSSIRGTIAMAKLPGDPNSATSEWFINLADNSANLDYQNGGFTVFGSVIDDGMVIADEIAGFPYLYGAAFFLGSAFENMPVADLEPQGWGTETATQKNLVMITTATRITRPIVRFTPASGDFGNNIIGDVANILNVQLRNTGNEALDVTAVNVSGLVAPFSMQSENCLNAIIDPVSISPTSSCSINLVFSATTVGVFTGSITVDYVSKVSGESFSVAYNISGQGLQVLQVSTNKLDFGEVVINDTFNQVLEIRNIGSSTFTINALDITGADNDRFSRNFTGCSVGGSLLPGELCEVSINYNPTNLGAALATLEVRTNRGNEDITLQGVGTKPQISYPASVDFGLAQVGQDIYSPDINLVNVGTNGLRIENISIIGVDAALFEHRTNCQSNPSADQSPINANEFCGVAVRFVPDAEGSRTATLVIESNDPDNSIVYIELSAGTGLAAIEVPSSYDVGVAQVGGVRAQRNLIVRNTGVAPLDISDVTGPGVSGFSQTNDCIRVPVGGVCVIAIVYAASDFGQNSAILTINSNDLSNPSVDVLITGYGAGDVDGISDSIELAGPNQGDGNNDDIPDDMQNNVASFAVASGKYVNLVSDDMIVEVAPGIFEPVPTILDNMMLVDTIPDGVPAETFFDYGLYAYNVNLPAAGGIFQVALFYPVDATPDTYYRYGPTPDNPEPHWYDFSLDETGTGAVNLGRVTITSASGNNVEKNMVVLTFVDGLRGDDDLAINRRVVHAVGGVSFNQQPEEAAGSAAYLWFSMLILMMRARRLRWVR